MARYKNFDFSQSMLVSIVLEDQILPGSLEYVIDRLLDRKIDLQCFDKRYRNDHAGARAYNPAILLKIVLYAYSKGILSSRKIAEACEKNVVFMALSGYAGPDFTTIAAFVSSMHGEIEEVFRSALAVCARLGLIGGRTFAADGCKLPSNAAKEWSGKFADLDKKRKKFEKTAAFLLQKHRETDSREEKEGLRMRRKKALRNAERIATFLEENEPRLGERGKEIQSNVTDAECFGKTHEHGLLPEILRRAGERLKRVTGQRFSFRRKSLLADTGFPRSGSFL